jgi:protein-disulfide isomerase
MMKAISRQTSHRMLSRIALAGFALASLVAPSAAGAEESSAAAGGITPEQRQAIEAIIEDYIADHPEVVVNALRAYQAQVQKEEQQQAEAALQEVEDELLNDPGTPVAGNPDGDVTIVEFFDYNCGYCKQVLPSIQTLLETDDDVRYVFKEFPILGAGSVAASRAALAVWNLEPEKYLPFHVALMSARGSPGEAQILDLAERVGVDPVALQTEIQKPEIEDKLRANIALGQRINVKGTPAFIINGEIIPGAVSLDALRELVSAARESEPSSGL